MAAAYEILDVVKNDTQIMSLLDFKLFEYRMLMLALSKMNTQQIIEDLF